MERADLLELDELLGELVTHLISQGAPDNDRDCAAHTRGVVIGLLEQLGGRP